VSDDRTPEKQLAEVALAALSDKDDYELLYMSNTNQLSSG
jgi:hypothetical protein